MVVDLVKRPILAPLDDGRPASQHLRSADRDGMDVVIMRSDVSDLFLISVHPASSISYIAPVCRI